MNRLSWFTPGIARYSLILWFGTLYLVGLFVLRLLSKVDNPTFLGAAGPIVGGIIAFATTGAGARQGADTATSNGSGEQPPAPPAGT